MAPKTAFEYCFKSDLCWLLLLAILGFGFALRDEFIFFSGACYESQEKEMAHSTKREPEELLLLEHFYESQ